MKSNEITTSQEYVYFVDYDKVWQSIKKYNYSTTLKDNIKGGHIDTLLCVLHLLEEKISNNPYTYLDKDKPEQLDLDAFRISKLAGYESSTIKNHIKKLKDLDVLFIQQLQAEYHQGSYGISLNPSYAFKAKPMGLILSKTVMK